MSFSTNQVSGLSQRIASPDSTSASHAPERDEKAPSGASLFHIGAMRRDPKMARVYRLLMQASMMAFNKTQNGSQKRIAEENRRRGH